MKGSKLKRTINELGWYLVRHGSSHDLYGHDDYPGALIPIPRHDSKEVPTGTANNILKMAGVK